MIVYLAFRRTSPIVNEGFLVAAAVLAAVGVFSITSGWRMHVDETEASIAAQQALGFPIGHASAQQVWRGLRSRPTWRVLCYPARGPDQPNADSCSSMLSMAASSSISVKAIPNSTTPTWLPRSR